MSKPNKYRIDTGATGPMTHNPFGNLMADHPSTPAPQADPPAEPAPRGKPSGVGPKPGRVVLRKETAHRGGKSVIVVDDFAEHIPAEAIEELSRKLRKACGCGGAVKDRKIELQGDQPEKIRALLQAEGFRVAGV
jgi:translation initiation factor 1